MIIISIFYRESPKVSLITTGIFGIVRHPAMSFFIGTLIVTPTMVMYNSHTLLCHLPSQTTSQLLFAITMTIYIVVSVLYLEERDLIHQFGSQYEEYKKTTPAFIPSLWRSHNSND